MHSHFVTLGAAVAPGTLAIALATAAPVGAAELPRLVSPGSNAAGAVAAARCPTFSWAGIDGAPGYELAIFRVDQGSDAEPVLVSRKSLPAHAETWTPSQDQCLERGQHCAWSVAATRADAAEDASLAWSPPFLFEVGAGPSPDELEQAIDTIRRYRLQRAREESTRAEAVAAGDGSDGESTSRPFRRPRADRRSPQRSTPAHDAADVLDRALTSPTTAANRIESAGATPTLDRNRTPFKHDVELDADSNVFKDGDVFIWDDVDGNTALGRNALASASEHPDFVTRGNTAVGRNALTNAAYSGGSPYGYSSSFNTAVGDGALQHNTGGYFNSALGFEALSSNTFGYGNTAVGYRALVGDGDNNTAIGREAGSGGSENIAVGYLAMTASSGVANTVTGARALPFNGRGNHNTAMGFYALYFNYTGQRNTAIGDRAGAYSYGGEDNVFLGSGSMGRANDTHTIRIGGDTGSGDREQNRTFVAGIHGITTQNADAVPVLIDSNGQLGTVSSSRRLKRDVRDVGSIADRLLELRPVAFRFKQHVETDPDTPLQFGLIAEEVAEVFPELVVYDEEGQPQTVKYHLLSALLIGEVQRLQARLEAVESRVRKGGRRK